MTHTPEIDVLLPVYNAGATLHATLASIAAQDFSDFRVIAIDDGSTDKSKAILAHWAASDSRFTVISQSNTGIVAALNRGLEVATAPLIARMDADDICYRDRFRVQRDYLLANADVVALAGRVDHIDECGNPMPDVPQPGDPSGADPDRIPACEPYLIHPFLMARRDAVVAAGGYRHFPYAEDTDLFWRLRVAGRLVNLDQPLGEYRLHPNSLSGRSIVNGRIMAVGSQLSAVAARQQADGRAAGDYSRSLVPVLRQAQSLVAMIALVAERVEAERRHWFRLAVGIKLLELARYRPYELESDDCRFIREQLGHTGAMQLSRTNRTEIRWYLTETAARLLRQNRVRDAAALAPAALWPLVIAKALLR